MLMLNSDFLLLQAKKSSMVSTDDSAVAAVQLSGGLDPLLMPHVLENIFKFCPVKDLPSCRMVSRLWNEHSTKVWRSRVFVKMRLGRTGSPLERFYRFIKSENYKSSGKPYRNFSLSGSVSPFSRIWQHCGSNIHVLELSKVSLFANDFRRLVYTCCPNIKELILRSLEVFDLRSQAFVATPDFNGSLKCLRVLYNRRFEIPWLEVLRYFSSLEVLQVKTFFRHNENITEQVFEAVEVIRRNDPNALKLKDIDMPMTESMSPAFVRVLTDPDLQLEITKITLGANGADAEVKVRDILWSCAATLKTLVLSQNDGKPELDTGIIFPVSGGRTLSKLEEISASSLVLTSLDFLKRTPNLKKFAIDSINTVGNRTNIIQNTDWDEIRHVTMSKCTDLEVKRGFGGVAANGVELLIRCFPNVEKLRMPLNNASLRLVCERWKNLNLLIAVYGSMLNESGITGLQPEDVKMVNDNPDLRLVPASRRSNVTVLKSLRVLSLQNSLSSRRRPKTLGHCSAIHGFLRLPNLQQLRLANFEMEKAAKNFLELHLHECTVDYCL